MAGIASREKGRESRESSRESRTEQSRAEQNRRTTPSTSKQVSKPHEAATELQFTLSWPSCNLQLAILPIAADAGQQARVSAHGQDHPSQANVDCSATGTNAKLRARHNAILLLTTTSNTRDMHLRQRTCGTSVEFSQL
jgi:hypothetical protein